MVNLIKLLFVKNENFIFYHKDINKIGESETKMSKLTFAQLFSKILEIKSDKSEQMIT